MNDRTMFRVIISVGTALQGLWIALPVATKLLLYVMLADVLTGICRAAIQGRLNSHCSWKGMMKKAAMLIFVGLMIVVDEQTAHSWHFGALTSMAFVGTEGISVLENLRAIGVPIPKPIDGFFRNMKKEGKIEDEEENCNVDSVR